MRNFTQVGDLLGALVRQQNEEHSSHDCSQHGVRHNALLSSRVSLPTALALLPLRYFPDDILTKVCLPVNGVTEAIQELAKNMIYTMMCSQGIGLAAPQVGKLLQLFVVDVGWVNGVDQANPLVFINPTLETACPQGGVVALSKKEMAEAMCSKASCETQDGLRAFNPLKGAAQKSDPRVYLSTEGCLSFPGASAKILRYKEVTVSALDLDGNTFTLKADGILGAAIQHEVDHLYGVTLREQLSPLAVSRVLKNVKKAVKSNRKVS